MLDKWHKKENPVFTGITRGVGGFGFGNTTSSGPVSGTWEILAYTDRPSDDQAYPNRGYISVSGYIPDSTTNVAWYYNGPSNQSPVTFSTNVPWRRFGLMGRHEFHNHTEANSGANTRNSQGDGDGFYTAAYNKTNLTKIALVGDEGTVDLANPENSTNHLVYDLVGTNGNTTDADAGTGSYTLMSLLFALSQYNRNNTNWSNQGTNNAHNQLFNGPDSRNFTSGGSDQQNRTQAGYSGLLQSAAGKMRPLSENGRDVLTDVYPNLFCFWGINLDSDHDTQVCCAYYGGPGSTADNPYGGYRALGRSDNMGAKNIQTTFKKGDAWRGEDPSYTFWSLWGNDWHGNSKKQNIAGTGTGNQDTDSNADNHNQGYDPKFGGSTAYKVSLQTTPGVHYPKEDNGENQPSNDPANHMVKKVYMLGFSPT